MAMDSISDGHAQALGFSIRGNSGIGGLTLWPGLESFAVGFSREFIIDVEQGEDLPRRDRHERLELRRR